MLKHAGSSYYTTIRRKINNEVDVRASSKR
jgi:hypothetical protein